MTLRQYLQIGRRWWWLVLLGSAVAATTAFVLTSQMTPIYQARAVILVNQAQSPGVVTYQDILGSQQLTQTYAELATSNTNLARAAEQLEVPGLDSDRLKEVVSARAMRDTQLIEITADDPDPVLAALIANTVASAFPGYIEEAQLAGVDVSGERQLNTVFVAESATAPTSPARPNMVLNVALGTFLGLLLMVAAVALIEYLDDDVGGREDIEALGAPFLGAVARVPAPKRAPKDWIPSTHQGTGGAALAEGFRQINANLNFALGASDGKVLLVTSSMPGEGKSTTAANLATVASESSKKVLLIDGDFRKPDIHRYFGGRNSAGLSSTFLVEPDRANGFLRLISDSFSVLSAGPIPPNPAELLSSNKMKTILKTLAEPFDLVIIDSPPLAGLADASLWAALVDGVMVVARENKTRKPQLLETIETVRSTRKPLIGVILNGTSRVTSTDYYGYGYGYGEKETSTVR